MADTLGQGLWYLAGPYSHPDDRVQQARCDALTVIAGRLMAEGRYIFSPITHTRPIAQVAKLPGGADFWIGFDEAVLAGCSKLLIAGLPGWADSKGVKLEMEIASRRGIPIEFLNPIQHGVSQEWFDNLKALGERPVSEEG